MFQIAISPTIVSRRALLLLAIVGICAALSKPLQIETLGRKILPTAHAEELGQINPDPEVMSLELGRPIEREVAGGQEHEYQIGLPEGQYASVVIEQRGIDVIISLLGPDGKSIADFDGEITKQGKENVEILAEVAGTYRLSVQPSYPKLPSGTYEIRWVKVRDGTEQDRLLHDSRRLHAESKRLIEAGKFKEALVPAEKALELRERVLGTEHPSLYQPLLNLFVINFLKGNHLTAETFCERAVAIIEKGLGPEHPLASRLLYNLAVSKNTRGKDVEAQLLLQRALPIQEKALGSDHPHVAHTLNRMAILAFNKGDFVLAESLFQRAMKISEKALGADHEDVANAANTFARLYREMGDYVRAEPLYERALAIYEKKRGPNSPFLAALVHNLATLNRDMGQFDKAERLYERAIAIREKAVGPDHPDLAGSRASLALLYYLRGDYAKAKPLYENAVATLERVLGPNHPLLAWHLSNLAKLHLALNENRQADTLYLRARGIYENVLGPSNYHLADILSDLGRMAALEGRVAQAVSLQNQANAIVDAHLNLNLAIGSERQKLAYLAKLPEQLNQAISLHIRLASNDPAARALAATIVLQRKGRVQDALSQSLAALHARSNAEDRVLLNQLNGVTSQLARLVLNEPQRGEPAELQKRIQTLGEQREKLEDEISSRSAGFYKRDRPVTLAAVQAAIPDRAALVEFAVYRPFDPAATDKQKAYGDPHYVAYVIPHQGDVQWTELGEARKIDDAIGALRQALRTPTARKVRNFARTLDEKIMQPVRALVGDATQLLVSPDGELNLIPFEALVDEQGRYLIERYSFAYLTSGRDLLRLQTPRQSKTQAVVFADPAFGNPALFASNNGSSNASTSNRIQFDYSKAFFGPLPGIADEVRALKLLLPHATFHTREEATEANLKRVSGPLILHIATHGFFRENDPVSGSAKTSDAAQLGEWVAQVQNPLLRSGLALAGANQGLSGEDDGVLTALEATALDLWGTKLVVLSACDTGVGQVKNGEGVYGLRRALFLAGTESQLMSLWPVSDRSTRDLMTGYYEAVVRSVGRGEALRQAQLKMLRNKPRSHPYYWASFILAGEWANLKGQR